MSHDSEMDVAMLQARLALIERVHRVALALTRGEQAKTATQLIRGRSHDLGNQIQIANLSALELQRRASPEQVDLLADLVAATEAAKSGLIQLIEIARPPERLEAGPPVAATLRAALDDARGALATQPVVSVDLRAETRTRATAAELEAIVFAAVLAAPVVRIAARERRIQKRDWVELLFIDHRTSDVDIAPPEVITLAAEAAGGGATLSAGREGLELAVELPVAQSSSSS